VVPVQVAPFGLWQLAWQVIVFGPTLLCKPHSSAGLRQAFAPLQAAVGAGTSALRRQVSSSQLW
jgi:hypothetical protein